LLRLALDARLAMGCGPSPKLEELAEQLTDPVATRRPGFRAVEAWLGGTGTSRALRKAADGFVGREHALRQLDEALQLSRRQPVLLCVRGESGIGKSALLEHFIQTRARQAGALALCGRCYERESLPYKALDGVMDELSQHLLASEHAPHLPAQET